MGAIHVVLVRHRVHRAGLGMVTLIVVHIHAGHAAVMIVLMRGSFF